MDFSPFLLVRQHFPSHRLDDIEGEVARQLSNSGFEHGLAPKSKVAIGVGSRGIANIDRIAGAAVRWWKSRGMEPFIFPAMGTHGAATAKGQAEVLAKYGITASTMGCPIVSSLAVVELGQTAEGIHTFMDRSAHRAAGVMLCGRVKWHTDFSGKLESGLFKMMAIGLGKFAGAQRYHNHACRIGMEQVIRTVGRKVLESGKILGGLAILEDGNHDTAIVEAVPARNMERREEELLALVKTWMPRIPLRRLDLLIVNEIGKTISGSGMDPKVVNRDVYGGLNLYDNAPHIARVFIRDLNAQSYGNAIGIGMADVVNSRLVRKMKRRPTYINALTACAPAAIRIPIHFGSDRECLRQIWPTVGSDDASKLSIAWIRNSQDLRLFACTDDLLSEVESHSALEIVERGVALEFDEKGDLMDWLT